MEVEIDHDGIGSALSRILLAPADIWQAGKRVSFALPKAYAVNNAGMLDAGAHGWPWAAADHSRPCSTLFNCYLAPVSHIKFRPFGAEAETNSWSGQLKGHAMEKRNGGFNWCEPLDEFIGKQTGKRTGINSWSRTPRRSLQDFVFFKRWGQYLTDAALISSRCHADRICISC